MDYSMNGQTTGGRGAPNQELMQYLMKYLSQSGGPAGGDALAGDATGATVTQNQMPIGTVQGPDAGTGEGAASSMSQPVGSDAAMAGISAKSGGSY